MESVQTGGVTKRIVAPYTHLVVTRTIVAFDIPRRQCQGRCFFGFFLQRIFFTGVATDTTAEEEA